MEDSRRRVKRFRDPPEVPLTRLAPDEETTPPMRTLTRHILIELTAVFTFALTVLTVLVMVWIVVKDLLNHGLPLLQIGLIIPYALPDALRFSIPGTLLLATTTVYSRMSGYNEVVALKALGISPVTILWPVWVVAFLLSLLTVWLNDVAVSWGRLGASA